MAAQDNNKQAILPQAAPAPGAPPKKSGFSFKGNPRNAPRPASTSIPAQASRVAAAPPRPAVARPSPVQSASPILAQRPAAAPPPLPPGTQQQTFSFGLNKPKPSLEQMVDASMPDKFVGELMQVTMYGAWGRGMARDDKGNRMTVVGDALDGLAEGARYKFSGEKSEHPKFGAQLIVKRVEPDVQSNTALARHIVNNFSGAGPALARKVIQFHEDNGTIDKLRSDLIHNPSAVDFDRFTTRIISLKDDEDSQTRRVKDSLSIRFGGLGISARVLKDLAGAATAHAMLKLNKEENGRDLVMMANKLIEEDPYNFIDHIDGYAFFTADRIAKKVGIENQDPKRIAALVAFALRSSCEDKGHNWLDQPQFYDAILRLDRSIDPTAAIRTAIERGVGVFIDSSYGLDRFYDKKLRKSETTIVDFIADRLTREIKPLTSLRGQDLEEAVDRAEMLVGQHKGKPDYKLDPSQRAALIGIMTSTCGVHTLTAGPGSGKTDIMEVMMQVLGPRVETVACAPVGKAAKELKRRIGRFVEPRTIHATLEYQGEFTRNAGNPLRADLVLADETSMLGTPLGASFMEAIPHDGHLIMLGDTKQLAAIEPGQVLKSMLEIEQVDHHRLNKTHRNAGDILKLVNSIGEGICEAKNGKGLHFTGNLPVPSLAEGKKLAAEIKEASERLGGLENVGVICPIRKGDTKTPSWSVTWLNHILREELNPESDASPKVSGTTFRLNDRIIITRNMDVPISNISGFAAHGARPRAASPVFDENGNWLDDLESSIPSSESDEEIKVPVVNGDTGWLESVSYTYDSDNIRRIKHLVLRLDDDRIVLLPGADIEDLSLAYAITTHAAQGSEYQRVVAFGLDGHESFMHRSMLFTMASRPKTEIQIIGEPPVLAKIAKRLPPKRNCAIAERVIDEITEKLNEQLERKSTATQRQVA